MLQMIQSELQHEISNAVYLEKCSKTGLAHFDFCLSKTRPPMPQAYLTLRPRWRLCKRETLRWPARYPTIEASPPIGSCLCRLGRCSITPKLPPIASHTVLPGVIWKPGRSKRCFDSLQTARRDLTTIVQSSPMHSFRRVPHLPIRSICLLRAGFAVMSPNFTTA